MPKIKQHAKNIPETEERQATFILETAQNQEHLRLKSSNI